MQLKAKIQSIELRNIALGKALSENEQELAEIKKLASKPTPANRKVAKEKRLQDIATFYLKRKIKK